MLQLAFAWLAAAAFAASLAFFLYCYLLEFGSGTAEHSRTAAVLWNVLLFSAFALHHSFFARTGLRNAVRRAVSPQLERAVYTLAASILFILVCAWWIPVPGQAWRLRGIWRWLGFAVQAAGILVTIAGARALDIWDLAGVRQVRETAPRHMPLETGGLYGFVRHPLYFGWVLLVFGAPDMTMTRLVFAGVSTLYLALAIPFEERSLIETFGPEYASYRQRVRWRMMPGVY